MRVKRHTGITSAHLKQCSKGFWRGKTLYLAIVFRPWTGPKRVHKVLPADKQISSAPLS